MSWTGSDEPAGSNSAGVEAPDPVRYSDGSAFLLALRCVMIRFGGSHEAESDVAETNSGMSAPAVGQTYLQFIF